MVCCGVQEYLRKRNTSEDTLDAEILRFKEERRKNVKQEADEIREAMDKARANRPRDDTSDLEGDVERSDDEDAEGGKSTVRGRGRGSRGSARGAARGAAADRGQRGGRGRGSRGRGKTTSVDETSRRSNKSIKDAFDVSAASKGRSSASFV